MHIAHARHRRAHAASPLPRRDREELTCVCWRLFVFFALSIAGSAAATAAEKNAKKRTLFCGCHCRRKERKNTYVFLRFFDGLGGKIALGNSRCFFAFITWCLRLFALSKKKKKREFPVWRDVDVRSVAHALIDPTHTPRGICKF